MMTDSRTIHIEGIGSILLEHNSRAKQTTVTVNPKEGVIVAVPIRMSFDEAMEFVNRTLDKKNLSQDPTTGKTSERNSRIIF